MHRTGFPIERAKGAGLVCCATASTSTIAQRKCIVYSPRYHNNRALLTVSSTPHQCVYDGGKGILKTARCRRRPTLHAPKYEMTARALHHQNSRLLNLFITCQPLRNNIVSKCYLMIRHLICTPRRSAWCLVVL